MSEKDLKKLINDELDNMKEAIDEVSEEELREIVGAGGDVNPETSYRCVATGIVTAFRTKYPFCK